MVIFARNRVQQPFDTTLQACYNPRNSQRVTSRSVVCEAVSRRLRELLACTAQPQVSPRERRPGLATRAGRRVSMTSQTENCCYNQRNLVFKRYKNESRTL